MPGMKNSYLLFRLIYYFFYLKITTKIKLKYDIKNKDQLYKLSYYYFFFILRYS